MHATLLLVVSLAFTTAQDKLSRREQEALVLEYTALSGHTSEDRNEQARILKRLEVVPWPRKSDLKRWHKTFAKNDAKGRRLEKKDGQRWYWEDEKRGKFYVGGNTKRPKGLFIGLHGGGVGSGDAGSSASSYSGPIQKYDWVGIFPEVLEKTELGWTTSGTEEWVMTLVDDALRTWDIDPQYVYLGGHSMGGYGSWVLGAHHADRWAALVPSAGAPTPVTGPSGKFVAIMYGVIPSLFNMPMCVFQSRDDPRVPPDANQFAVARIGRARQRWGGYEHFEYWEVDGRGHGWPEGGVPALLEKIASYERTPHPETIVWQPALDWKRQFYWLYWTAPTVNSVVVARLDREQNTIDIELTDTKGEGLHVLLGDALVDMDESVTVRVDGQVVFQGVPQRSFPVLVMTGTQGDPGRTYEAMVPVWK